jgi:serine/threonine-protein kinase 19
MPTDSPASFKIKLEQTKTFQKRRRIQLEENQSRFTYLKHSTNNVIKLKDVISVNNEVSEPPSYSILDKEFGTDEELAETLTSEQFSSTNLAMQKLRGLFSSQMLQMRRYTSNYKFILPPIILRHMLYAMVEDRTEVDRQIDEYLKENKVRQFHLYTLGRDAIGYVFTEDYVNAIHKIIDLQRRDLESHKKETTLNTEEVDKYALRLRKQREQNAVKFGNAIDATSNAEELEKIVLERFEKDLLPKCRDTFVSRDQVRTLLACQDRHINVLIRLGLLTIKDEASFWFSVPNVGLFLDYLVKGREELVERLKRKKYKEMMLHTMESTLMKKSPLGNMFHVRDLLGSGCAECIMTSNGAMIALRKTTNKK